MFVLVVLLFVLYSTSDAEVRYRCSNSTNTSLTFTRVPSDNEFRGQYTVERCTTRIEDMSTWLINLQYFENPERCAKRWCKPNLHSETNETIINPVNCTHVCYSIDFDLIFASCYEIDDRFITKTGQKKKMSPSRNKCITINNNLTLESYKSNTPHVAFTPHKDYLTLEWFTGLPVSDYEMSISNKIGEDKYAEMRYVTQNCSIEEWNKVRCDLQLPAGGYKAILSNNPAWYPLLNEQCEIVYKFSHKEAEPPVLQGSDARVWWACGVALLAVATLLAATLARRSVRARNFHKDVLESWLRARGSVLHSNECEASRPVTNNFDILLLYAREGEHGQRAVAALKALLQQVTAGKVLDVQGADVTALAGPAPTAWLRGVLQEPTSRVLLLQSPALAALYDTKLARPHVSLREPLLGRRAMYRAPQFGDQLLALALRLVAEGAAHHHRYNKYYIATYASLETDIVQQVVPYRRYMLPTATLTLLRDISSVPIAEIEPALLQDFCDAVEEFMLLVRTNPDYLMDELVVM